MKNELTDIEWIEQYIDGSLSPEGTKQVEQRLAGDAEFLAKFKEHKMLIEGIRYAHLQARLGQLRSFENSLPAVGGKQIYIGNWWKGVAAAAVFVVAVTAVVLINRAPSSEELFAQYFKPYPNVFEPTMRGGANKRHKAFDAYDAADYATASKLFTELLQEKEDPNILLLLGNANLAQGKVAEAKNNFLTLIKNFDERDEQAKWFLALCYLKEGDEEKATLILQELGDPQFTYSKKAKELLRNVK